MRPTPLFDTNVFSDVALGKIASTVWASLKKLKPRQGWPLSSITAMELLAGIDNASEVNFESARIAIAKAFELSAGRVLKEPRALLCEKLLKRQFPEVQIEPKLLSNYLLVASRAKNKREIVERQVFIRRDSRRTSTYGGFDPSVVAALMKGQRRSGWKCSRLY
jgi:predicted nucleic acid-binding protein